MQWILALVFYQETSHLRSTSSGLKYKIWTQLCHPVQATHQGWQNQFFMFSGSGQCSERQKVSHGKQKNRYWMKRYVGLFLIYHHTTSRKTYVQDVVVMDYSVCSESYRLWLMGKKRKLMGRKFPG